MRGQKYFIEGLHIQEYMNKIEFKLQIMNEYTFKLMEYKNTLKLKIRNKLILSQIITLIVIDNQTSDLNASKGDQH